MAAPDALVLHTIGPDWSGRLRAEVEDRLPDVDLAVADSPAESVDFAGSAEVAIIGRLPEPVLEAAGNLRWVQTVSAGVDFLDLDRIEAAGVKLTNAAGVHAEPIAEQVLGYMLVFERNLHEGFRNKGRGVWERYEGGELRGKTLGVVGVGAIGSRVAELGSALGMTVVGTKRDTSEAVPAVDDLLGPDALYEVLDRSDYVVLACPLTEETRGLLGMDELRAMGGDAVLVNVARGEVVDEAALIRALQHRVIRGAALDVFDEEPLPADSTLWDLSNVVVTPHMAGSSPHGEARLADLFAENYRTFRDGEALTNRIV